MESPGADVASPDMVKTGCVFVLQYENTCDETVGTVLQHVKTQHDASSVVCLGPRSTTLGSSQPVLTPSEYHMRLLRRFDLHSNERQMLLGEEDHMIAVQLCLAELNKKTTGDFDVEVSKVLEVTRRLQKAKLLGNLGNECDSDTSPVSSLDTSISGADVNFDSFQSEYAKFLVSNNYLDLMDLSQKVRSEVKVNEELAKVIRSDNFLLLDTPRDQVEKCFLRLLMEGKSIYWVRIAQPLAPSGSEDKIQSDQILVEKAQLEDILNASPIGTHSVANRSSVTEAFVEKIMFGYLHLLMNSRSEMALARVINIPERGLDIKAFTDIKHVAQLKGLSLFQTVSSFVMKMRMRNGVEAGNKLLNHVKGLAEFTDLMHKLQTILEEESNPGSAVQRVLNVVKNTIVKCQDTAVRRSSVEAARDHLQSQADWILSNMDKLGDSPSRAVSAGGSLMGRQALRVLRCLLDHAATQPATTSALNTLTDVITSQKTPLRFPSVISQFRSPMECSPEAAENKSLVQRMKEKFPVKKPVRAQYGSCLDWAQPLHNTGIAQSPQSPFTLHDYVPNSKTIVHPGRQFIQRRPLETLFDQENTDCPTPPADGATCEDVSNVAPSVPARRPLGMNNTNSTLMAKPATAKRPLQHVGNNDKPSKRPKIQSSQSSQPSQNKKSRAKSKKAIPLQKGQKTLGAFFRI